MTRVKDLKPGEKAVITGYEKNEPVYRERLLAMGLIKGTEITILKKAPMGDPVTVEARGSTISLRRDEAQIMVLSKSGE